ncbi:hypothetical protein FQR65_LT17672 [Abscondita terminalis]|nr:hypothetical protein FQR65_LT17672 [Abscondita terminalis]
MNITYTVFTLYYSEGAKHSKPPYSGDNLNEKTTITNAWLETHLHGLGWDHGKVSYRLMPALLREMVGRDYVKVQGNEKVKFLRAHVSAEASAGGRSEAPKWTTDRLLKPQDPLQKCALANAEYLAKYCEQVHLEQVPAFSDEELCVIIVTTSAIPVQITTGAFWKPLPEVITYSATIPLTYEANWEANLLDRTNEERKGTSCKNNDITCKISNEIDSLIAVNDKDLIRTHEAINMKYFEVSTKQERNKSKRALDFIGDFFAWCCGVATERKIDQLVLSYEKMQIFMKQLHSGLENSLVQISNNSKAFNDYHNQVENNLIEIREKITKIQQFEEEFKNKIGKTFSLTEEKLQRTVMHVYDTIIRISNLGRVMSQIEILNTCKSHKIASIIVNPQNLLVDLKKLSHELNKKGHMIAIPTYELSRYYKLSIADCTTVGNKLYVHIKIPIVTLNQKWQLYELITLKSISGTSLHHCKPYHDKLCYLTRFDSDAIYGPQCAYKMYTGATVEELKIDSDTFIITHPKRETYILCENKKLAIEKK